MRVFVTPIMPKWTGMELPKCEYPLHSHELRVTLEIDGEQMISRTRLQRDVTHTAQHLGVILRAMQKKLESAVAGYVLYGTRPG